MSFKCTKNTKRQCNVEHDSGEAWFDATIKSKWPVILQDEFGAVRESAKLGSVDALHFRFDDVNGIVSVH